MNPSPGIQLSGFGQPNSYLLNYSSGVMQVYGDYKVSGSTLSLDYLDELYASNATTPVGMMGSSLSRDIGGARGFQRRQPTCHRDL